ncbi:MAG: ABC transporter permease [Bifidobacterium sp.]|jgi:peptide/nickel transport system permease protein|nr:ABC transporter permease [Bifidobacterium sp.]MCH4175097.1 ABC transporter permease [Bifidobacterium sp.]
MLAVVKRLLLFLAALFGMSLLVFAALRILPGDVASVMAGVNATPQRVETLREQLGLNRSIPEQYGSWLTGVLRGDFGTSLLTGRSISAQIAVRSQVTFPLIAIGMLIALLIGIPSGCAGALATSKRSRQSFHVISIVGGSIPALWGGLLLILLFGRGVGLIGIFPSQGFPLKGWASPIQATMSLFLPAMTVGIIVAASIMRYTRSALNEVMDSSFIDMGRACGMTRRQATLRIGLRIIAPQLVSVIGLTLAEMITGVVVVENLFALQGLGSMLITDVGNRDLLTVQSELFLLSAFFLAIGLLVDVVHQLIDPRLRTVKGRV